MEVIVKARQNIFDIAIQYFGDISFVAKIINDNGLPWSAPLETGQKLQINSEGLGNAQIKNFFALSGLCVENGATGGLSSGVATFDSINLTWDRSDATFDTNPNII